MPRGVLSAVGTALDALAGAASVAVGPGERAAVVRWLEQAKTWNAKLDLTAARTDAALAEILVFDALHLARIIPPDARVVDVGTGAGAPGLGVALLRPDVRVVCIEPLQKRAAFLRSVVGAVGAEARVHVLGARVDPKDPRVPPHPLFSGPPSIAISRATFSPSEWAEVGLALAPEVVLMLVDEPGPLPAGARIGQDHRYAVPSSGAKRRLLTICRADT